MKTKSLLALFLPCLLAFATPASAETIFKILSLTPNNVSAVEANGQISDDRGGIAVSGSKVFLVGDGNTGIWNRSDLSSPTTVGAVRDSIVSDLGTGRVYTLADANSNPIPSGGGTVTKLVQLDSNTGALTMTEINLSASIDFNSSSAQAGIFSGYNRIVLVNGDGSNKAYNIDIPSGFVTTVGTVTSPAYANHSSSESWAFWGVAEFFNNTVHVAYMGDDDQYPRSHIFRTNVRTNASETIADFSPMDFSDGHEFTVVPSLGRWYFHYEGGSNSIAGSRDETLGYADATFLVGGNTLYAVDGAGGNPSSQLYIIKQNNGSVFQTVGSTGAAMTGIAFDPTTGILYGSESRKNAPGHNGRLFTIDPTTGAPTLVGSFGVSGQTMADITFTSDGTLYGWAEPSQDDLYTIDKTTGAATKVGDSGLSTFGSGLAANSLDTLFFAGDGSNGPLNTINKATGASSLVVGMSGAPLGAGVPALAFDPNDVLYGLDGDDTSHPAAVHLTKIDTQSGAVTDVGATVNDLDAIAFGPGPFVDVTPPVITTPGEITVARRKKESCHVVFFNVSAVDDRDGPVPAFANPPSGTCFPLGTTTVTVTATDSSGNQSTATFHVNVRKKGKRH